MTFLNDILQVPESGNRKGKKEQKRGGRERSAERTKCSIQIRSLSPPQVH